MTITAEAARRIQLLSPHVANAIAAGEVVERPSSVIKELCENAIDAGARSISVTIDGGGMTRISVVDDGCGIPSADLPLAVARHATSKIASIDDLAATSTLGFRGEALASIAAISRLTIRTAQEADRAGREIQVEASKITADRPAPAITGTTVEVRDLFFNTPARLRFLKAERTESSRAIRMLSDLALTQPHIRFTCVAETRTALKTTGESLLQCIGAVFGKQDAAALLPVNHEGTISVTGFAGQPHRHRGQRNGMVFIVNGRRVQNRALYVAAENAYRSLIPAGRYPFCVLAIDVPAHDVDVNVHPAKTDVRFADERAVFAAIERACWEALNGATLASPSVALPDPVSSNTPEGRAVSAPDAVLSFADGVGQEKPWNQQRAPGTADSTAEGTLASLAPLISHGQITRQWIVAESPAGLVIVDQHAAHEKLLYTRIMNSDNGALHSQLLLVPAIVELAPDHLSFALANLGEFSQWGIDLEEFGPSTLRCMALPAIAGNADAARLVSELLEELAGETDMQRKKHRAAAMMACHSAVRFGDALGEAEQQRLLDELVAVPTATTCPHGRPTVYVMNDRMLRTIFSRP